MLLLLRLAMWRDRVANIWRHRLVDVEQAFLTDVLEMVNDGLGTDALYGTAEATAACLIMQDANELMLSDGIIYTI